MTCLKLEIKAALQAYGSESYFGFRPTELYPTKSAVAGMICAAMGIDRSEKEEISRVFNSFTLRVDKLDKPPKIYHDFQRVEPAENRLYHEDKKMPTFDGGKNANSVRTIRKDYIMDQTYTLYIEGSEDFILKVKEAFDDPWYPIYLGRKNCIPSKFRYQILEKNQE